MQGKQLASPAHTAGRWQYLIYEDFTKAFLKRHTGCVASHEGAARGRKGLGSLRWEVLHTVWLPDYRAIAAAPGELAPEAIYSKYGYQNR